MAKKMRTDDEFINIDVDKMIVNYGFIANNKAMQAWKINLESNHRLLVVDETMATNIKKIFMRLEIKLPIKVNRLLLRLAWEKSHWQSMESCKTCIQTVMFPFIVHSCLNSSYLCLISFSNFF